MTALHRLHTTPGLLRLLSVRLTSQLTDGAFQAALGGAILFNPERHAAPLAVAAGLAVLLLPYSIVGPFAGALLDHWDRRSVLIGANLLRAAVITAVATTVAAGAPDAAVLACALAATGASRFVASGLSAALPHVTHPDHLVATNAFFVTAGSAAVAAGAGVTVALRALLGSGNSGSAGTLLGGVVLAVLAAAIAHRFHRKQLGPDTPEHSPISATRAVATGLLHGARAAAHTPTVASALAAIGAHRLAFGLNTLMLLVMTRHTSGSGGLLGISMVALLLGVGLVAAAPITPLAVARIGRGPTLVTAMLLGAGAQLVLLTFHPLAIAGSAIVIGLAGQVVKLCGDAAMQSDIDDARRGQVFSFQDAIFNVAYVIAVTVAALMVTPDGHTPILVVAGAALYLLGALAATALRGHPPMSNENSPDENVHPSEQPSISTVR